MEALLLDSNVWVASTFPSHPFHHRCMETFQAATAERPVCFCRSTEQSFLRLITSPRILDYYGAVGMTNQHALAVLKALQTRPQVKYLSEPTGTYSLWHQLASRNSASPKVWMDAYLAAFAIAGRFELVTLDRDLEAYQKHGLHLRSLWN